MFRNSSAETTAEAERSYLANFFGQLEGFLILILIVTGLVALCVAFIAANTAGMTVRERAGEIAVLRALGFGRALIFGTLIAETGLLSLVAGGLGALSTLALTQWLRVRPQTLRAMSGIHGLYPSGSWQIFPPNLSVLPVASTI